MKNIKSLMLLSLLMVGSVVFANNSSVDDFGKMKAQAEKNYKQFTDKRNELKKNGTPYEKASITAGDLVVNTVSVAIDVGVCSFVTDVILASFDATKNMPHRGTVATGSCAVLYAALYASFKDQEMQKSKNGQQDFYDWLVSWIK